MPTQRHRSQYNGYNMFNSAQERSPLNAGISMGRVRGVSYNIMNRDGTNRLDMVNRLRRRSSGSNGG